MNRPQLPRPDPRIPCQPCPRIRKTPYAAWLGIRAELRPDGILFVLPALHGGMVGGFMEQAAALHLLSKMDRPVLPRIIDFSLDYLRPARLQDTHAECQLTRQGRQIANVSITAWQEDRDRPNAIARAHFLIPEEQEG